MQSGDRSVGVGPGTGLTAVLSLLFLILLTSSLFVTPNLYALTPNLAQAAGGRDSFGAGSGEGDLSVYVAFLPAVQSAQRSRRPIIVSFATSPALIGAGSDATLRWEILNAVDKLTLEPGSIDVTGLDEYMVSPNETTTYLLTAQNQAGSTSANAVVTVGPPEIASLAAFPETVFRGQSASLRWSITGYTESLTLEPGGVDVTGQTSALVTPGGTTTYTLVASNAVGSDSAQVKVTVEPPPEITGFSADPDAINYGESTTLSWTAAGTVESLVIQPDLGDVMGLTEVTISPTETTTYTLTASSPAGSDTAQEVVRVSPETELLIFDWNKPVVKSDSGFPVETPQDAANEDWTGTPNFAEGTYHYRVEIRSQPVAQEMQVQYCVWQKYPLEDEQREACAGRMYLIGDPGAKATGFEAIKEMWTKYEPIDYSLDRTRNGAVIRNEQGKPVSGKQGWDWNGENPDEWYPLDWRFTVVVVAKGETFSGWGNYLKP